MPRGVGPEPSQPKPQQPKKRSSSPYKRMNPGRELHDYAAPPWQPNWNRWFEGMTGQQGTAEDPPTVSLPKTRQLFRPDVKLDASQVRDMRDVPPGPALGDYPEPTWYRPEAEGPFADEARQDTPPKSETGDPWAPNEGRMGVARNPRDEIKRLAGVYGVPESVALAVAQVQSGFDQSARYGDKVGLMGVKANTVTHLHDVAHWRDNIRAGLQRLYDLRQKSANWRQALTEYDGEQFARNVATVARDIKSGKVVPPKGDPGVITLSRPLPTPFRPLSDFGRRGPGSAPKDFHTGVDLAAPEGTPVAALTGGKVVYAGQREGAGITCMIRDASGREWVYAHMRDYDVKEGATVKPGDRLGSVGHTGDTSGNALHIGVRIRGEWQNPLGMVQRAYGTEWGKTSRSAVAITDFYAPDFGGPEVGPTAAQAPEPLSGEPSVTSEWQRIVDTGAQSPEVIRLARERGAVV